MSGNDVYEFGKEPGATSSTGKMRRDPGEGAHNMKVKIMNELKKQV